MEQPVRRSFVLVVIAIILVSSTPARAAAPITLDIRDLDIYDAVRLLSTQSSTNLVLDSSVAHRTITLRLQGVSFDEALAALVQSNDLAVARLGKMIYLGTPDAINRRYASASSGNRTRTFVARNIPADALAKQLADALPPGTLVVADRRSATVIVTGPASSIERADRLLGVLDRNELQSQTFPLRYLKAVDAARALQATATVVSPASIYPVEQQN
jgi:type II secretory pathway component GspD/PulD (secretin)